VGFLNFVGVMLPVFLIFLVFLHWDFCMWGHYWLDVLTYILSSWRQIFKTRKNVSMSYYNQNIKCTEQRKNIKFCKRSTPYIKATYQNSRFLNRNTNPWKAWMVYFKLWKRVTTKVHTVSAKLSFIFLGEINMLHDEHELKEFQTTELAL
jgi:hypothetical protein